MLVTRRSRRCQCAVPLCVTGPLGRNTQTSVTLMDRHGPPSVPGDLASSQLSSNSSPIHQRLLDRLHSGSSTRVSRNTLNHLVNQLVVLFNCACVILNENKCMQHFRKWIITALQLQPQVLWFRSQLLPLMILQEYYYKS